MKKILTEYPDEANGITRVSAITREDYVKLKQSRARVIDGSLRLTPYYPAYDITLPWYQDRVLCRQTDNRDEPYTIEKLKQMYDFLDSHGDCFYIEYEGRPVGDVTLRDNGEICIVISRPYQNRRIGRRCVAEILRLAGEKGFAAVTATIFSFNLQSRRMFAAAGFRETGEEQFTYDLTAMPEI